MPFAVTRTVAIVCVCVANSKVQGILFGATYRYATSDMSVACDFSSMCHQLSHLLACRIIVIDDSVKYTR